MSIFKLVSGSATCTKLTLASLFVCTNIKCVYAYVNIYIRVCICVCLYLYWYVYTYIFKCLCVKHFLFKFTLMCIVQQWKKSFENCCSFCQQFIWIKMWFIYSYPYRLQLLIDFFLIGLLLMLMFMWVCEWMFKLNSNRNLCIQHYYENNILVVLLNMENCKPVHV